MQRIHRLQSRVVHRRGPVRIRGQQLVKEDRATRFRRRLVHPELRKNFHRVRVLPFQNRKLLGRTLGNNEDLAPPDIGPQEAGDPLCVMGTSPDFHQLDQIAQVQNRMGL